MGGFGGDVQKVFKMGEHGIVEQNACLPGLEA